MKINPRIKLLIRPIIYLLIFLLLSNIITTKENRKYPEFVKNLTGDGIEMNNKNKNNTINFQLRNKTIASFDKFFHSRKLETWNKTDIDSMYKELCIKKNYSYELINYIDPLSTTLTQYLNFSFIKNSDSSVNIKFHFYFLLNAYIDTYIAYICVIYNIANNNFNLKKTFFLLQKSIINYIQNQDLAYIIDYVKANVVYFVFLLLGIISLLCK